MKRPEIKSRDERVLFAFAPPKGLNDVPLLMFIIPDASWQLMIDGNTHDFDLTPIGIPIKAIIGRASDHEAAMKLLNTINGEPLEDVKDFRDIDVGIKGVYEEDEKPQ